MGDAESVRHAKDDGKTGGMTVGMGEEWRIRATCEGRVAAAGLQTGHPTPLTEPSVRTAAVRIICTEAASTRKRRHPKVPLTGSIW